MKSQFTRITCLILLSMYFGNAQSQCTSLFTSTINTLTVDFTNQASGNYNWIGYDYGDGNFEAYIPSPTHVYTQAGIYLACQYIQDTVGFCFDSSCDTLYLGGATCQANFDYFPDGLNVEFYDYSIGIFDSLVWSFGDGTTSQSLFPMHTYANAGTYNACLSLYSGGSICDSTCTQIVVDTNSCSADFSTTTNGLSVDFTNLSTGGFDEVYWDFGDGFGTSQVTNPSYTYFVAGTYTVCLDIYDTQNGFCSDFVCIDVTVTSGGGGGTDCQADFTYVTDELDFVGTNTSTGSFLTAIWDFGDGSNPAIDGNHTYAAPGVYDVCLTVANIIPFCINEKCQEVNITENTCEVDFEWSFNDQNVYSFGNLSTGNFTSVKWTFGDGNSSTFASPSYTYNQAGAYEVCLTTFENGGQCGKGCKMLDVYALGNKEIEASAQFVAYPNPTTGQLTLSVPLAFSNAATQLWIKDISGRVIETEKFSATGSHEINLEVKAGTYFIELQTPTHHQVIPIIVE